MAKRVNYIEIWDQTEAKAEPAKRVTRKPKLQMVEPAAPQAQPAAPNMPPWRQVNPWVWVPTDETPAPGAAELAKAAQGFRLLFDAARREQLPNEPLTCQHHDGGEDFVIDNVAAQVRAVEREITALASICARTKKPLSVEETDWLTAGVFYLDWICACWTPEGWRDIKAIAKKVVQDGKAVGG